MWNRAFASFVVVFWAVMMAALIRVEIFPKPTLLDICPTEQVLRKIFSNPNPARLIVYRGRAESGADSIGNCSINIHPRVDGVDPRPGELPDSYEVRTDLNIRLPIWGISFWQLEGSSTFNKHLDLESFDVRMRTTRRGESFRIVGNDATKKVTVHLDFGDYRDERTFDFGDIQRGGLASGLGLPVLPNLGIAGLGGESSSSGHPRMMTTAYYDRLDIAGTKQRVYLIDSKLGDQIWTKIWVSEADGEVLKVSTSLGFDMVSELIKIGGVQ